MKRRDFLKKTGVGAAAAVAATAVNAPYVLAQKKTAIRWRMQTYAGPALAEHVIKPSIDAFNKAANGEMVIELSALRPRDGGSVPGSMKSPRHRPGAGCAPGASTRAGGYPFREYLPARTLQ